MSGGHFDYNQYKIAWIVHDIKGLIFHNDSDDKDSYGDLIGRRYSPETIAEFKKAVRALKVAQVYAQRIDWLVSGDDGEESFHQRLNEELTNIPE
jgi:hypothetical protein